MAKTTAHHAESLIAALRSGDAAALETLYGVYREDFFRWAARRFEGTRQDFEDAWQDAVIAFYQQVRSGKIESLRHEARVWLFAVGYKRLLSNHRKLKRILWKDEIDDALLKGNPVGEAPFESAPTEQQQRLQSAMKALSPQCRDMLVQRYYQEQSIEDIRQEWDLQNANTASATLSRCLRRLKEIIQNTLNARV